jgi:hypothetical protein
MRIIIEYQVITAGLYNDATATQIQPNVMMNVALLDNDVAGGSNEIDAVPGTVIDLKTFDVPPRNVIEANPRVPSSIVVGSTVQDRNFAGIIKNVDVVPATTASVDGGLRSNRISATPHVNRIARIGEIKGFLERSERDR